MSVIPQQKDLRLVKIVESSDKDSSSQAKVSVSELSDNPMVIRWKSIVLLKFNCKLVAQRFSRLRKFYIQLKSIFTSSR